MEYWPSTPAEDSHLWYGLHFRPFGSIWSDSSKAQKRRHTTIETVAEKWNRRAANCHQGSREIGLLTLDVNGDTGLFAIGDCLVGGLTDDLLTRLDVGRRQIERAHCAFPPAVPEQGLQGNKGEQGCESCKSNDGKLYATASAQSTRLCSDRSPCQNLGFPIS